MRFHGRAAMAFVCLAVFGCAPSDDTGGTSGTAGTQRDGGHQRQRGDERKRRNQRGGGDYRQRRLQRTRHRRQRTRHRRQRPRHRRQRTGDGRQRTRHRRQRAGGTRRVDGDRRARRRHGHRRRRGTRRRDRHRRERRRRHGRIVDHPAHGSDPICRLQRHTDHDVVMPRFGEHAVHDHRERDGATVLPQPAQRLRRQEARSGRVGVPSARRQRETRADDVRAQQQAHECHLREPAGAHERRQRGLPQHEWSG